jgi:hypothetical protein
VRLGGLGSVYAAGVGRDQSSASCETINV